MNFDQILELVKTVSDSELTVFQYEEGNQKITMQAGGIWLNTPGMEKAQTEAAQENVSQMERLQSRQEQPENIQIANTGIMQMTQESSVVSTTAAAAQGNVVTSPLVGKFYTAPSEDAEAFVKVGDTVKKGQVLAIVEAMKLMNEIESDYEGVVTEILADNGQGVEYGQPLFRIS